MFASAGVNCYFFPKDFFRFSSFQIKKIQIQCSFVVLTGRRPYSDGDGDKGVLIVENRWVLGGEGSLETKLSSSPVSGDTDQWKEPQSPTHISVRLGVLQEGFTILKNKLNCLYSAREKSRPRQVAK